MALKISEAFEDRIIYYACVGSCIIHICFLTFSFFLMPLSSKIKARPMEIRYHALPREKIVERPVPRMESVLSSKENLKIRDQNKENVVDKQLSSSALLRDAEKMTRRVEVPDKQPLKMTSLIEKRSISVPVVATQKITNPNYIGYNDRIRDKIRNRAYFYIDDPQFQQGEVYLTFIVTSDGNLKDLQIIGERTHANDYLRAVGLRSVKESSPFPPFPASLKYPELSFNVVISFQVNGNQ